MTIQSYNNWICAVPTQKQLLKGKIIHVEVAFQSSIKLYPQLEPQVIKSCKLLFFLLNTIHRFSTAVKLIIMFALK